MVFHHFFQTGRAVTCFVTIARSSSCSAETSFCFDGVRPVKIKVLFVSGQLRKFCVPEAYTQEQRYHALLLRPDSEHILHF
jgi:hypothetical protein